MHDEQWMKCRHEVLLGLRKSHAHVNQISCYG
jgi:hypothetical protein